MRMIEAQPRRAGGEGDAPHAICRDVRRALFGGAIDIDGNKLSVPMQLLRRVGVVMDVDDDALALGQPQQRTGKASVVGLCRDRRVRAELDEAGADTDRIIGGAGRWRHRVRLGAGVLRRPGQRRERHAQCKRGRAAELEEPASAWGRGGGFGAAAHLVLSGTGHFRAALAAAATRSHFRRVDNANHSQLRLASNTYRVCQATPSGPRAHPNAPAATPVPLDPVVPTGRCAVEYGPVLASVGIARELSATRGVN